MMGVGSYRLLLAMLVAISHMGVMFVGFNPGVVAVVSFLIISGFVMTPLIDRSYNVPGKIGLFYLDRLLRLYPQFLLYFVLSCAVIHFLLPGTPQAAALTIPSIASSIATTVSRVCSRSRLGTPASPVQLAGSDSHW